MSSLVQRSGSARRGRRPRAGAIAARRSLRKYSTALTSCTVTALDAASSAISAAAEVGDDARSRACSSPVRRGRRAGPPVGEVDEPLDLDVHPLRLRAASERWSTSGATDPAVAPVERAEGDRRVRRHRGRHVRGAGARPARGSAASTSAIGDRSKSSTCRRTKGRRCSREFPAATAATGSNSRSRRTLATVILVAGGGAAGSRADARGRPRARGRSRRRTSCPELACARLAARPGVRDAVAAQHLARRAPVHRPAQLVGRRAGRPCRLTSPRSPRHGLVEQACTEHHLGHRENGRCCRCRPPSPGWVARVVAPHAKSNHSGMPRANSAAPQAPTPSGRHPSRGAAATRGRSVRFSRMARSTACGSAGQAPTTSPMHRQAPAGQRLRGERGVVEGAQPGRADDDRLPARRPCPPSRSRGRPGCRRARRARRAARRRLRRARRHAPPGPRRSRRARPRSAGGDRPAGPRPTGRAGRHDGAAPVGSEGSPEARTNSAVGTSPGGEQAAYLMGVAGLVGADPGLGRFVDRGSGPARQHPAGEGGRHHRLADPGARARDEHDSRQGQRLSHR
jgi:hypothetical protein